VLYEHGDPRWNDTDKGKLLILPPDLSGNLTSTESSGSKQKERTKRMMNVALQSILENKFLYVVKSCDMGLMASLPFRRKACCGFLSPLNTHLLGWV
jgi:hypothetical protein